MATSLSNTFTTDKWFSEAEDVFSDKEFTQVNNTTPTLNSVFKDLDSRYKANIKSWWEVKGLESYVKNDIVPKGLRIAVLPAQRSRTPNLMKLWEKEVTASSIRLMKILLEEEKITLENTSTKLKETIQTALKLKEEVDFSKKEGELQANIEKYTTFLKERKHQQFVRDLADFRENRAYLFLNPPPRRGGASDISSSDTDISDSERRKKKFPPTKRSPYSTRYRNRGGWQNNKKNGDQTRFPTPQNAPPEQVAQTAQSVPTLPSSSASASASFLEKTLLPSQTH